MIKKRPLLHVTRIYVMGLRPCPSGHCSLRSQLRVEEALVDYELHQSIVNNNLKGVKKNYGMFFTPERIVDFMVNLIDTTKYTDKKGIKVCMRFGMGNIMFAALLCKTDAVC